MIISHIVAVSENNVIGKSNKLPWHMPADMAYFNRVTKGHYVIMGRNNYESEGKALKDRINIVITRNREFKIDDGIIVYSINEALDIPEKKKEKEVFIVGGGNIYKQSIDITDRIYLTRIHTIIEGDVFYPELNMLQWKLLSEISNKKDNMNPFDYTFYIYERK
ncbi:MAG: dihydrofolate reductase [Bacteroidales bacterium]|nr:MAG: dihydrofolate reductase [Bacteroidales bacterium]